ncbi:MAG TPA: tungsten ABC transporter substrate-binding protein [Clostridiales bacterium UBA8960]|jgi:tungstate transport system substrate-binding protein|nr:tungsten ABC transporter substrate-binding protein [Clostridiales bacterium UBA8960]
MTRKLGMTLLLCVLVIVGVAIFFIRGLGDTQKHIVLATTTSTQDSGLLDAILPKFEAESGIEVRVVAVGTGAALKLGRDGDADVLLVHSKSDEMIFVQEGHGLERFDVMYNDFILVGPLNSEVVKQSSSIEEAFSIISKNAYKFISRGDDSGTHKKELQLWSEQPVGDWYISAGKGMGDVLQMTNELQGFTLTDRATYYSMKTQLDLEIVFEGDASLLNNYGVIAVNPSKNDLINQSGAEAFIKWLLSEETQTLIGTFGVETYGSPLFFPNAK